MSFGARLTQARKEKGLTQDGLGKGLGTDGKDAGKAVVYGWEKDQHYPRVDQLVLICKKLEVTADYLLFGKVEASSLAPDVLRTIQDLERLPKADRDNLLSLLAQMVEAKQLQQQRLSQKDELPVESSFIENVRSRASG